VLGSIIFARAIRQPLGFMLSSGALAVGLAYVGFSVVPSLTLACVAALVGGAGQGVQWASLISSVQRLTPAPLQGRIMGAVESIGAITPAIGLSLGGAAVALSSARDAFRVIGICAALTTVAFIRLQRLDPHDPESDLQRVESRRRAGDDALPPDGPQPEMPFIA
jgi:sugar phosphate permease